MCDVFKYGKRRPENQKTPNDQTIKRVNEAKSPETRMKQMIELQVK